MRHGRIATLVLILAVTLGLLVQSHGQDKNEKPPTSSSEKAKKGLHETYVIGQKKYASASRVAIRIAVKKAESLTKSVPVDGASVKVTVKEGEKIHTLFEGKTNANGQAPAQFTLPELKSGSYDMVIETSSDHGKDTIREQIQVVEKHQVLLVTDKPLYQPAQIIQIRALALHQLTLKPVAGKKVLFEVEDNKGNKVFKKRIKSSGYGIASAQFQLADEVNMGTYKVRAVLAKKKAEKSVTVKKYVLPKFKINLKTKKNYYLPKEKVKGSIQADYIFGKPVVDGQVKITASTFDVKFRKFFDLKGKTGQDGSFDFEFTLPKYFVGQPLEKGDALVKLDVEVQDKADHVQQKTSTFPVVNHPIRVTAVAESGKLVPGLANQIYVVATYPDGRPAKTKVEVKVGKEKTPITGTTDDAGIATLSITPNKGDFTTKWTRARRLRGRHRRGRTQKRFIPIYVTATDKSGHKGVKKVELGGESQTASILLRPDQAIYQGGDTVNLEILSSIQRGTVYLDLIKSRQTLLTDMVELKQGRGKISIPASSDFFGTIECHAYILQPSGTFVRDTRMVYVHPPKSMKIAVSADKKEYRPGQDATLSFTTTDSDGNPVAAALGLTIVDEAVYALQEIQPGLEKVYFTIEKELSKPKYQIKHGPGASLTGLVMAREKLEQSRQKAAKILFSQVDKLTKYDWNRNPQVARQRQMAQQIQYIYYGLLRYARQGKISHKYPDGDYGFPPNLLEKMVKDKVLNKNYLKNPMGGTLTIDELAKMAPVFKFEAWAKVETSMKIQQVYQKLYRMWRQNRSLGKNDGLTIEKLVSGGHISLKEAVDSWGNALKIKIDPKNKRTYYYYRFRHIIVYSAGPDGVYENGDDLKYTSYYHYLRQIQQQWGQAMPGNRPVLLGRLRENLRRDRRAGGGFGGAMPKGAARPETTGARPPTADGATKMSKEGGVGGGDSEGGSAPRVREYFPETLLFEPQVITDDKGVATFKLKMADSITTWRLTAGGNSQGGLLGGTTSKIKVFQDFFVDIDFPVALTQDDEVEVPVAVYNYLPGSQEVKLVVQKEDWFELQDKATKKVTMKSRQVGVVYFRLKAKKIGRKKLTVMAYGSKLSDAVRRSVEIVPNGQKVEQVINGRLAKTLDHNLVIPPSSIDDSGKILVKVYPGVGAVLIEGLAGLIRLPGG